MIKIFYLYMDFIENKVRFASSPISGVDILQKSHQA